MNAVFLDFATMGATELDRSPLSDALPGIEFFDATAADERRERIRGAAFVLTNKVRIDRELIDATPDLKFIGLTATGTDNIDLQAAAARSIAVCNIRAYCTQSVVEHVFAVLLSFAHSIGAFDRDVRKGEWQRSADFCMLGHPIHQLSAMTMGIVGYGVLGRAVAETAKHFGMRVLIARRRGEPVATNDGRTEFTDLLREADVISLHCPLNEETRGLFGADEFRRMKPNAILINTARGGLVDSAALVEALKRKQIAAAGIDVLPKEPPSDGDPLIDYAAPNLLVTPHIAWATVEARQNAINELAANIHAFQRGEKRNRVV
ncbi:MAG TPA: D-2-hydroxyacid dehydrogenase [Woeseiaceae bacterium]|nr:D-2-hydroxyacid dehydrogenase [Woeseiaceae bacterium]